LDISDSERTEKPLDSLIERRHDHRQRTVEEYRVSEERQDIIRVLEEAGEPMPPKEVADLLDKAPNAVKYLMWRMSKDGQLEAVGKGRYSLTTNPANPLTPNPVSAVSEVSGDGDLLINDRREAEF
jgi:predicted transcriptional regulator of viral defense system